MTAPLRFIVIHGPNLNMLGTREPEKYGTATLDDVENLCAEAAEELGLAIDFRQSNIEGELVSWIQECRGRAAGIVAPHGPVGGLHAGEGEKSDEITCHERLNLRHEMADALRGRPPPLVWVLFRPQRSWG